jgi:hypothetical protein
MTTPDFRALCAELTDRLQHAITSVNADSYYGENRDAVDRARAALAEAYAAEANNPPEAAVVPVAVSERLPGEGDCDAEGRCWIHQPHPATPETPEWRLAQAKYASVNYGTTHWAAAHAIPLPQAGEVEG